MRALLRGGPGHRHLGDGGGETAVWQACLYEQTGDLAERRGEPVRVYEHRPDCCESYGRGAEDRCG